MRGSGTPPAVAGAFCFSENSGVANLATVERKRNAGPFDFAQGRLFDFILASQ
jgi:hypothetical protein